jgi:hypothetical protein
MNGDWFNGQFFISLKDAIFEKSTAARSMCELVRLLQEKNLSKPVLLVYTDGGSEHRSTFASVWLATICAYIRGNLDYLVMVRTAPGHSWMNWVERGMAIANIALSGLALARDPMATPALEKLVSGAGSMKEKLTLQLHQK